MKSHEGIQKFIEYKRSVEKERPMLTAEPRLITIDGIDGSGKSTIAMKLAEKLRARFGEQGVILVDITNLRGAPKQEKLGTILRQKNIDRDHVDAIYAAGVNRAYKEIIIPALKNGKIVITDRSEVDLLRYALGYSNDESIKRREKYIADGTITHRLWAGNRIFIEANPEDAWKNLKNREYKSQYDPGSVEEVERNVITQHSAEEKITSLPYHGQGKIIVEKNTRVEDKIRREDYLNKLVNGLLLKLVI